jgi:GNAT superfamily N-acetyltransferase
VLRVATLDDAPVIAELVNAAFRVEDFFKAGDRTDVEEVRSYFATGEFLVLDGEAPRASGSRPAACVYLERDGAHAYFGMLSIDPARQGQGLGRVMLEGLEARCREAGCREIEIHVVDLRHELPPFYRRFGYVEAGTLPFPDDGTSTKPCHFIVMKKHL